MRLLLHYKHRLAGAVTFCGSAFGRLPTGINTPFAMSSGRRTEVTINDCTCHMFSGRAFGLENGLDFSTGIAGKKLVHAEGGEIIVPVGAVHTVIDSKKPERPFYVKSP